MRKNNNGRHWGKSRDDANRKKNTMDKENLKEQDNVKDPKVEEAVAEAAEASVEETAAETAVADDTTPEKEIEELKEKLEKEKKEYLFLMAEFDNFRKRTLKEKSELIKNAGESVFKGLLPIVDDFERALKASQDTEDAKAMREGMELIYKKLKKFMEQNGVKEMDPEDREFDADRHEAISAVPVPDPEAKGKILDTVEKGYTINDKVLRHAKVVVGQ